MTAHLGFIAVIALMFALVGNRGLIKNSIGYARFVAPAVPPGAKLEFDLRIDHPLAAQLFWKSGPDFSEGDSARRTYEPHSGLQTLSFPLPSGGLKALRFDPIDGAAKIVIRGIRVVDLVGRTLATLPLTSLESVQDIERKVVDDNLLTIETTPDHKDPILVFNAASVTAINQAIAQSVSSPAK